VGFLDSSCLHALLDGCRMAEQAGGTLTLASPQPVVARMIALWGADRLIAVHATVEEAAGYGFRPRLRGSGDIWKIQGEGAA
jgi:anti-anti-sigma regulatory factor